MCETQPGRAPSLPRSNGVHTTVDDCSVAACRFSAARSLSSPPAQPDAGSCRNEASTMVHSIHPFGLPLTCGTQSERAPLGFPLSFAPSHYWPRTPGRGPVLDTDRSHAFDIESNLQSTDYSQRATSCRKSTRHERASGRRCGPLPRWGCRVRVAPCWGRAALGRELFRARGIRAGG